MSALIKRVEAAQWSIDTWLGTPFAWWKADCRALVIGNFLAMGWSDLPATPVYSSGAGARRALKAAGHASLPAAVQALGCEKIAPAAALPGDLAAYPGAGGWAGMGIVLGQQRLLAFAGIGPDGERASWVACFGHIHIATSAWSVQCRR